MNANLTYKSRDYLNSNTQMYEVSTILHKWEIILIKLPTHTSLFEISIDFST